MEKLTDWKFPLFIGILLSVLYVHYYSNRAFVELDIKVTQITWFKIYWAAPGKPFSEERMVRVRVRPEETHYRFFATDLRKAERLRIDPHQYEGVAVIKKMVIAQDGYAPLVFATGEDFARLRPLDQIIYTSMLEEGFHVFSSGGDPNLELIPSIQGKPPYLRNTAMVGLIFAAVFLFFTLTASLRDEYKFLPLFFAVILVLIMTMSGVSAPDVHPDEYVHVAASKYYMDNWLPPRIEDPAIRHTYSVYGFSRLNNREVYYFLNGKAAQLLAPFKLADYQAMRVFNLFLFGSLLLMVLRSRTKLLLAVPFLISPQVWYQFSYCNSDAFAVFITFFAVIQVVEPDSLFNRFLRRDRDLAWIGQLLLLGLFLASLVGLKKNYYFFLIFLGGYLLWKAFVQYGPRDRGPLFRRLGWIVLAALLFMGLRVGIDYWVNGLDRADKIARMRLETAAPLFSPNTPLKKMHFYLYRKARGDSLRKLVIDERWFGKTFRSAFGMYGYFTITGTDVYYNLIMLAAALFLFYISAAALLRGPPSTKLLVLLYFGSMAALIGTSLWHSWTSDFQTQGRYLFPLVPMLSVLVYHARRHVPDAGFRLFLVAVFVLSVYSFVYNGLLLIPHASVGRAM
ncbi:MAG: hypothetical protein ACYCYR_01390 [Desulfobulbaceae bacterium]